MSWHPEIAYKESPLAVAEVVGLLRASIDEAVSVTAWAREHNVSVPYIYEVMRGTRQPGAKILAALGLEKIVAYQPEVRS